MAKEVEKHMPDGYGFIVMAFPLSEGGRLFYASNADRKDVLNLMKEFIINNGADEDWLKHIK